MPPQTRTCYVCGRQYGINSYEIHLRQCKELWVAREELKPDPRDRKPLPLDPTSAATFTPKKQHSANTSSVSKNNLDELNRLAIESFNSVSLDRCEVCGRTFLPEKLLIHQRSCSVARPARRVDEPVNRKIGNSSLTSSPTATRSEGFMSQFSGGTPSNGVVGPTSVHSRKLIGESRDREKFADFKFEFVDGSSPPRRPVTASAAMGRNLGKQTQHDVPSSFKPPLSPEYKSDLRPKTSNEDFRYSVDRCESELRSGPLSPLPQLSKHTLSKLETIMTADNGDGTIISLAHRHPTYEKRTSYHQQNLHRLRLRIKESERRVHECMNVLSSVLNEINEMKDILNYIIE
jgi:hypothetical protein